MKTRVRELTEQGNRLFEKKRPLHSLWQTMAENFNPIRADFTAKPSLGEEFASHLMTGRPVLARRDLSNSLSAMLRPRGTAWFHARTHDEALNNDTRNRQWLDAQSEIMRRVMYDQRSQFVRATKQGDDDFILFGQTVIQPEPNRELNGILYRTWHLRDVAWCENAELVVDTVHRDWQLEARALARLFPRTVHSKIHDLLKDEPYREIKCRHIVIPADDYDHDYAKADDGEPRRAKSRHPFISLYIDIENDTILEEVPRKRLGYVIPRWVTVSGSQYAHSPATVVALPDARLLQQMTLTLLEAGQKAVDPPMKATEHAISGGGVNLHAGGVTWVDYEYDEKLGAAIEPLIDTRAMNFGFALQREEEIKRLISEAFFLNVINLPDAAPGDKMTAYETQKRVEEYIRRALPLFEPMEVEYNGGLCEETFQLCMDLGAFGAMDDMPPPLRGQDIRWQFDSPLQSANDRVKSQAFEQAAGLLAMAAQIDPSVRHDVNLGAAFRDALTGIVPSRWIVPEDEAAAARQQEAEAAQVAQAAQELAAGAEVAGRVGAAAETAGNAAQSMQAAGLV